MDSIKQKIVLTGGHAATTALATIEELVKRSNLAPIEIHWIGQRSAVEGKSVPTLESGVFPKHGVFMHPIISGKVQTKLTLYTIPAILKIPLGFMHAFFELLKVKPRVILSFGGSTALPVVITGWLLRIPVIIHEQVATAGRANRFSAIFAKKVAIARNESNKFYPENKTVLVGNPILSSIAILHAKKELGKPPTIFVTGGSRGSQRINKLIEPILEKLLSNFRVIHQCGFLDLRRFEAIRESLPDNLKNKYEVYDLIDPMKMHEVYRISDIMVGRAGANTVSEILAVRLPSILIPIPWTYLNEQGENAKFAQKEGIAKVLDQEGLTGEILANEINELIVNREKMIKETPVSSKDEKAASRLVDLVSEYLD